MPLLSSEIGNGKPAARVDDKVACPSHGTTSIVTGSPNTFFDYKPAAVMGDETACGDTLLEFSSSVLINGRPAAVMGCATAHGGTIITGSQGIIIGTAPGSAPPEGPVGPPMTNELEDSAGGAYSLAFDFSTMLEAGNHSGINYGSLPIKVTTAQGTYITTIWTDDSGISGRFFTDQQEEVIAWVKVSDHWEVTEEYEVIEEVKTVEGWLK